VPLFSASCLHVEAQHLDQCWHALSGLENDEYVRKLDGYLPTAEVAFIDEIFKANSAILNALLTLLNERLFDNGNERLPVPLLCLVSPELTMSSLTQTSFSARTHATSDIAPRALHKIQAQQRPPATLLAAPQVGASNELPESEELDALYDRFLIRRQVAQVSSAQLSTLARIAAGGRLQEIVPGAEQAPAKAGELTMDDYRSAVSLVYVVMQPVPGCVLRRCGTSWVVTQDGV
jgi:MoxR-like ATPase